MSTPNCRCSYCLNVNRDCKSSKVSRGISSRGIKSRGISVNEQDIKSRDTPVNEQGIKSRGIHSRGLINMNKTSISYMTTTRGLPMNTTLSASDQIKIANQARRARVWLTCCKGQKTDKGVTKAPTVLIDIIVLGALCVAALSMWLTAPLIVDIAGAFMLAFAPYIAIQKRQLLKLGTFRSHLNEMRRKVNNFMIQNDRLTKTITDLKGSVERLEVAEGKISNLTNTSEKNVDRLVYLVKENKRITNEVKKNTQAQIVQQLTTTVLRTDQDLDLMISPEELERLMTRLDATPGFDLNRERFKEVLGDTTKPIPVGNIMKVIRNLKDDSVPEEHNVFVLRPEQHGKKSSSSSTTSSPSKKKKFWK